MLLSVYSTIIPVAGSAIASSKIVWLYPLNKRSYFYKHFLPKTVTENHDPEAELDLGEGNK